MHDHSSTVHSDAVALWHLVVVVPVVARGGGGCAGVCVCVTVRARALASTMSTEHPGGARCVAGVAGAGGGGPPLGTRRGGRIRADQGAAKPSSNRDPR